MNPTWLRANLARCLFPKSGGWWRYGRRAFANQSAPVLLKTLDLTHQSTQYAHLASFVADPLNG